MRINLLLAVVAVAAVTVACALGSSTMDAVSSLAALVGTGDPVTRAIVWEIRLPRALAALGVGASLGLAGAALQGMLRNPLAEPGTLGVSAAAALGAVIAIYFNLAALSLWATPVMAIALALAATSLVLWLGVGRVSVPQLILIGVGIASFAGAMMTLVMNLAPNPFSLADMVNWLMGSVANRSLDELALAAPFWAVGALLLASAAPGLRALSLGEETAIALGANVADLQRRVVIGTALLVGASVAIAGTIGFVGIVAPHLVRGIVRHDPAALLLPSALLAGTILVLADIAVRLLPFDFEFKLGVAAALVGAPAFIAIAARVRTLGQ